MKQQQGAALIVVLVLLTISLMLGLSGVQSSLMDERMAGNYRAATLAQMAAEASADKGVQDKGQDLSSFVNLPDDFDYTNFKYSSWKLEGEGSVWEKVCAFDEDAVCDEYGAYAPVYVDVGSLAGERLGLAPGFYVIGVGAVLDGSGQAVAESLPVFVKLKEKYSFKYALTVLGGIKNVNNDGWYPASKKAKLSNGGDPRAGSVYYEGEPHICEENGDEAQDCYLSKGSFEGDVVNENYLATKRFKEFYKNKILDENGNLKSSIVSEKSGVITSRKDVCDPGDAQFVFVKDYTITGNELFCGVMIVWGGGFGYDPDLDLDGSASLKGLVLVADFADQDSSEPEFDKQEYATVKMSGGGKDGGIIFNKDVIVEAFERVGINADEAEELVFGPSGKIPGVIVSWQ